MLMKMAVIGCGNMAEAIVLGASTKFKDIDFHTYTPSYTRAESLAKKVGGAAYKELSDLPDCDFYLLACKPQQVEELASHLSSLLPERCVLISILAGTSSETLREKFKRTDIVRVMPNTPALVGEGVHVLYFSDSISEKIKKKVESFFESVGDVFIFQDEEKIDVITGFSGSGPAYLFEFGRIMTEKLVSMGVDLINAEKMIKSTLFGSAKLMKESSESAEELRNKVTSKNGVTYEALEVLKKNDLQETFSSALDAAYKRSKELAKGK